MGRLLKQIGVHQVLMARSAEDAPYNLTKNPRVADVVLLDFGLPGMSGLKFLEQLRDKGAPKNFRTCPLLF